jgi:hypothetical protein
MSRRKAEYVPKSYESKGKVFTDRQGRKRQETNVQMFETMLTSEAYMDLKVRQRLLYVYVKAQLYGHRKPKQDFKEIDGYDRDDLIYFSWKSAQEYGLYSETDHSTFYKDMRSLMEHGFIEKYADRTSQREKTIYLLSDKWQTWAQGTDYAPQKKAARNPSGTTRR